ncbi:MAG TPA: secretin N-terminal domain-containing protein, partial [Anaerolineales bacterium]|nr:secretin N-terminal domain-containing protein [Anaerolineales bacterium]
LPPVTSNAYAPPPKPRIKTPTYSVVVHEVPVKELLLALARDTKENIDIHPGLQGLVSLNAIDETLPAILDRISRQVNMRYTVEGKTIVIGPDSPFLKTYKVAYVNMTRDTTSSISVSGQITSGNTSSGAALPPSGGTSMTAVTSTSKNNFWEILHDNVQSILTSTRKLSQSADERQAQAEATRTAREERLAQAEAVARAGQGATTLFDKAFGPAGTAGTIDVKQDIIINQVAGTVSVMGTELQHQLVERYLDSIGDASQRQVLIEATIAEVALSKTYQAGVNWSSVSLSSAGFSFVQALTPAITGSPSNPTATGLTIGYANNATNPSVQGTLKLLEQFGNVRVLSSPKLMAMNNQTALLKVVDNVVYFTIQSQISQGTTTAGNLQSFTTTPNTVAIGVVLSLTPQINENGIVTLDVRPTITRVRDFVQDPNPALIQTNPNTGAVTNTIKSQIPEVTVREMESVLQLVSGQTAILGGLMQDSVVRNTDQIPGLGAIPRVGEAFQFRSDSVQKTELIVFVRPIVVANPSLNSDELKHLRKFLPDLDKTGQNP